MNEPVKIRVAFYCSVFITGGMEMAVYHLIRCLAKKGGYEFVIVSRQKTAMADSMMAKYAEYAELRSLTPTMKSFGAVYRRQPIDDVFCDVLVNCSNWEFVHPLIHAKKVVHWFHTSMVGNPHLCPVDDLKVVQSVWQRDLLSVVGGQFEVLSNIMDVEAIKEWSKSDMTFENRFVVVSRISPEKGWERLIEFMQRDVNKDMVVLVLGAAYGKENAKILTRLKDELKEQVHLLGEKSNPYPYIALATAVLVFSDIETYGLVSKEAHILGVPVVFNHFDTAKEQFIEGVDQWIDEFEPKSSKPFTYVDEEHERVLARWGEILHAD